MIVSIIAYDRATVQCIINSVIPHGGINEVRLLEMENTDFFSKMIYEHHFVHNFHNIYSCNLHDLLLKDGILTDITLVVTGSQQENPEYMNFAQSLMSLIVDELVLSKPEATKFVFADNTRGLLQQACFESFLLKSGLDPSLYQGVVLSSIYQMSKVLNCDDGRKFRCYPLSDGSVYVYDPTAKMTAEDITVLEKELRVKLFEIEQLFDQSNCDGYPNVEGKVLSEFLKAFVQSGWQVALSSEELHSRKPTPAEMKHYNLEDNFAVFLPSLDVGVVDEEFVADEVAEEVQVEFMPPLIKKHVKKQSLFIKSLLG